MSIYLHKSNLVQCVKEKENKMPYIYLQTEASFHKKVKFLLLW